jgi:formyl-CoA transferase
VNGPLGGVRILDLTQVQAGPSCTQLLAWLGADVIKIEEPGKGDRTRWEMADRPGVDSFYYLVFNANKRGITLNLKSDEGVALFKRLAAESDVVVENYAPGRMESFGLGPEVLAEQFPRLVVASIKGFGSYGPDSHLKSYENVAQAAGGAMSTNGFGDRAPVFTSAGVGDSGSGLHCAIGILAALRQRDQTGIAPKVEVSMQDAVLNLMRVRFVETLPTGEPVLRSGNRVWGGPDLVFPCLGGGPNDYVSMVIGGDAWDSLLAVAGRADLIGDERYMTDGFRPERPDEVGEIISAWTKTLTKHEVMATLAELGIPCSAVRDTAELMTDPQLRAREMMVEVSDAVRGDFTAIGCPIKIDGNAIEVTAPPLLSQHTDEVLGEVLGIDAAEAALLREQGAV